MWRAMDFVASINIRTYIEFAKLGTRGTRDDFKDGEPEVREIEVEQIIADAKLRKLEADYLEVAKGGSDVAIQAVKDFFDQANLPREVPRLCRGGSSSLTFPGVCSVFEQI